MITVDSLCVAQTQSRHQSIHAFPSLYIPMFMHTGDLTCSEVLKTITFTEDSEGEVVLAHLNQFIMESNNKCICGSVELAHTIYSIFLIQLDYPGSQPL